MSSCWTLSYLPFQFYLFPDWKHDKLQARQNENYTFDPSNSKASYCHSTWDGDITSFHMHGGSAPSPFHGSLEPAAPGLWLPLPEYVMCAWCICSCASLSTIWNSFLHSDAQGCRDGLQYRTAITASQGSGWWWFGGAGGVAWATNETPKNRAAFFSKAACTESFLALHAMLHLQYVQSTNVSGEQRKGNSWSLQCPGDPRPISSRLPTISHFGSPLELINGLLYTNCI